MDKVRSYPSKRRKRGDSKEANLTMLSARIANELCEYVQTIAYETRKSKQDIIAEALRLHMKSQQANPLAE